MRRGTIAIALVLAAACGGSEPPRGSTPAQAPVAAGPQQPAFSAPPVAAAPQVAPSDVPPIPFMDAARPPEIVRAVYTFAAEHPEVLSKVPCFCGCQSRGHRANDDCFVAGRDASGRVTEWEPHGAT